MQFWPSGWAPPTCHEVTAFCTSAPHPEGLTWGPWPKTEDLVNQRKTSNSPVAPHGLHGKAQPRTCPSEQYTQYIHPVDGASGGRGWGM